MKRKISLLFLSMMALFFIASCDDDDDKNSTPTPNAAVTAAFKEMFPKATNTTWSEKDNYQIASFLNEQQPTTAWFNPSGVWYLTQADINLASLPKVISDAIAKSAYAKWTPSSASTLKRKEMVDAYVVELKQNEKVIDLYYTTDGYLFASLDQDGLGNKAKPNPLDPTVKAMINQYYSGAKIVNVDKSGGYTAILWLDNTYFEFLLDKDYKWIQSEYTQSFAEVPQVVKDALKRDGYAFNDLYDVVTRLVRPQGTERVTIYRFEMNNSTGKVTVYYDANGTKVDE